MITSINRIGTGLRAKTIFLSASIPSSSRAERYQRVPDAAFQIEQAVISLARAVFSEGGTLVFGGHPAISPLVAMVAGEYREPLYAEGREERRAAPIRIFQSRAFEGFLPSDTLLMYQLGYTNMTWVDAVDHERFDPKIDYEEPPCPKSLFAMRESMIKETQPVAMVGIGGMEGVEGEFQIFRALRPQAPIYLLERTGGAALTLSNQHRDSVRVIDTQVLSRIDKLRAGIHRTPREEKVLEQGGPLAIPYPLIMQTIVEELIRK